MFKNLQRKPKTKKPRSQNLTEEHIMKICDLSSYLSRWIIRGKILSKSNLHEFTTGTKISKVFNIILSDDSGVDIRGSFFGPIADQFFQLLQQGSVYNIQGGKIVTKKKGNTDTTHAYEIIFNEKSQFHKIKDFDPEFGEQVFNFKPLEQALQVTQNLVDIIGLVINCSDIETVISKKNGLELKHRRLILCDENGFKAEVSLWNEKAKEISSETNYVLAIKNARVNEYNGYKSFSLGSDAFLKINPKVKEALELNALVTKEKTQIQIRDISGLKDGSYAKLVVYLKEIFLGRNLTYRACSNSKCFYKKMSEEGVCPRCGGNLSVPRFLFDAKFVDHTGEVNTKVIGDDVYGVALFGMTAMEVLEKSEDEMRNVVRRNLFREFEIKVKMTEREYKGVKERSAVLVECKIPDYGRLARELAESILEKS